METYTKHFYQRRDNVILPYGDSLKRYGKSSSKFYGNVINLDNLPRKLSCFPNIYKGADIHVSSKE